MALKVVLLAHSPDPERAVATAARNCYSPRDIETIDERWTPSEIEAMVARVREAGHLSTFEHTMFTFGVSGVSRALTHQLVRHRHMSFEQKSQRYIEVKGRFEVVTPPSVAAQPAIAAKYDALMTQIAEFYANALAAGVPAEDARFALPNAAATQIVVTANARALLDFFTLRTCNNAQWEIRELAFAMLRLAKRTAPALFVRAGATCVRGYCNEPNGPDCPRYIAVRNPARDRTSGTGRVAGDDAGRSAGDNDAEKRPNAAALNAPTTLESDLPDREMPDLVAPPRAAAATV